MDKLYVRHKFLNIEGYVIHTALDAGGFAFLVKTPINTFIKVWAEDCNAVTVDPS